MAAKRLVDIHSINPNLHVEHWIPQQKWLMKPSYYTAVY